MVISLKFTYSTSSLNVGIMSTLAHLCVARVVGSVVFQSAFNEYTRNKLTNERLELRYIILCLTEYIVEFLGFIVSLLSAMLLNIPI